MIVFVLPIFDGVIINGHPICSVVDVAVPPQLKYWMPIHYDTIEDEQNKKSHLLFSFLVKIVLFCILSMEFIAINIITSFSLVSFEKLHFL